MKNLSKDQLHKKFLAKNEEWVAIQKEIENNNITDYGHKLYKKNREIMETMKELNNLINQMNN